MSEAKAYVSGVTLSVSVPAALILMIAVLPAAIATPVEPLILTVMMSAVEFVKVHCQEVLLPWFALTVGRMNVLAPPVVPVKLMYLYRHWR